MRRPTFVMVHHSATLDGTTFSWQAIRRFHTSWRVDGREVTEAEGMAARAAGARRVEAPWRDVGYHAGVELVGSEYEAVIGRPETDTAAACPQGDMNVKALHICIVGNFDVVPPPQRAVEVAIHRVVRPWLVEYGIPVENVVPHHLFNAAKTCPGALFDMDLFRSMCR